MYKTCFPVEVRQSQAVIFGNANRNVGGNIPPNPENELKLWRDVSFRNTVQHLSGQTISMPPIGSDYGQWNVPKTLRVELDSDTNAVVGGASKDFQITNYRMCW